MQRCLEDRDIHFLQKDTFSVKQMGRINDNKLRDLQALQWYVDCTGTSLNINNHAKSVA